MLYTATSSLKLQEFVFSTFNSPHQMNHQYNITQSDVQTGSSGPLLFVIKYVFPRDNSSRGQKKKRPLIFPTPRTPSPSDLLQVHEDEPENSRND